MTDSRDSEQHRPRRRFGQNFLQDSRVVDQIVQAVDPQPGQSVVEIGPGKGVITGPLLARLGALDVVELDRDLAKQLPRRLGEPDGLRIHQADALKFDFSQIAGRDLRVVGNLPYNISTPLLFRLLGLTETVKDMHFMLQAEVVDRITAVPGTKAYGRLSVMCQIYAEPLKLFTIGPQAFQPRPRVTSAFLRIGVRQQTAFPIPSRDILSRVVTQAFSQRRKTLRNGLKQFFTAGDIESLGIDPGQRPETLRLEQFAALARAVDAGQDPLAKDLT